MTDTAGTQDEPIGGGSTTEDDPFIERYREATKEPDYVDNLSNALRVYQREEQFNVGDLVTWKPGMRTKQLPIYDAPAIVIEYITSPIEPSAFFPEQEREDLRVGLLDGQDTFHVFSFPSSRFQVWKPHNARD
ncbi:hypothetical protein EDF42_3708 [Curtobacterium sp. PhB172]|uniref:hypothetical protein n=1 Tax=Curtobacterium sp. PhB172 TaxID=2485196 RepID=UPI000F90CCDA|nr:hypothetical protein [Curtobacterium sp. PhB172]ROS58462.1 hypothetical protein EDF42_3708 [Curtobacterium sp. PhB172]